MGTANHRLGQKSESSRREFWAFFVEFGCHGCARRAAFDSVHDENTTKFDFDFGHGEKIQNHKLSEICNY